MRNNSTRLQGKNMISMIINKYIEKKKKSKVKKKSERTFETLCTWQKCQTRTPQIIRPFTSFRNSYFKNEAKYKSFKVKMSFICIRIKNHFHINDLGCFRLEKLKLDFKIRFRICNRTRNPKTDFNADISVFAFPFYCSKKDLKNGP